MMNSSAKLSNQQGKALTAKKSVRITGDGSPESTPNATIKKAQSTNRPQSAGASNNDNSLNADMTASMSATGPLGMSGFTDYESKTREELERMLEARQKSYIERERVWKIRINELEEELAAQREEKTGWMRSDTRMKGLKNMQSKILENVELVQDRTARILQEQERDLLRAFRARLFDVQAELEKEKNKKDDGAAAWIERSRKLEAEVEWAKEVADRLERVNQTLLQENNRLKSQFSSQEEDRNFLIKQLVSVKKDNARLRAEYTELENVHELLKQENNHLTEKLAHQAAAMPSTGKMSSGGSGLGALVNGISTMGKEKDHAALQQRLDSEERYKELNGRLRRLLTEERKALASTRSKYEAEMAIRTDMEMLLRHCVEDVRKEIAHRYAEEGHFTSNTGNDLAKLYSKQPGLIPIDDFSQGDRERVLELLLSQERVVSLIYAKTFPIHNPGTAKAQSNDFNGGGGGGGLGNNQQLDVSSTFNELGGDTFPSPTAAEMRPSTTNMTAGGGGLAGTKLPSISTGGGGYNRGASR